MIITKQLIDRQCTQNTLACVGLDPDISKFPAAMLGTNTSDESKVLNFLKEVVNLTASHVCAYKPQKAFFDLLPGGHAVLQEIVSFIHETYPGIPVLMDCKVGDIDNTMNTYMRNILDVLGADGMIVNPYMGDEVIMPFSKRSDKAGIVLVRTSNPGSVIMQEVILASGNPYWVHTLNLVVHRWNTARNLIAVISSTAEMDMQLVRRLIPQDMPILLAGIGAQGGDMKSLSKLLNTDGVGVYVNSSRGILYAQPDSHETWQKAIERSVIRLKDQLNEHRGGV